MFNRYVFWGPNIELQEVFGCLRSNAVSTPSEMSNLTNSPIDPQSHPISLINSATRLEVKLHEHLQELPGVQSFHAENRHQKRCSSKARK